MNMKSNQIMISHEFRAPLTSSLMLLDNIIGSDTISEALKPTLWIITSSINMLLCLVND